MSSSLAGPRSLQALEAERHTKCLLVPHLVIVPEERKPYQPLSPAVVIERSLVRAFRLRPCRYAGSAGEED